MRFVDNLKRKVGSFSEETVRHVDWDEEARKQEEAEEEFEQYDTGELEPASAPEPEPESDFADEKISLADLNPFGKRDKPPKEPKEPKAPKPVKEKPPKEPKAPKVKPEKPVKPPKPPKEPKPVKPKPVKQPAVEEPVNTPDENTPGRLSGALSWLKSAVDKPSVDDDSTAEEHQKHQQQIQDILEFLDIPGSYEVPMDILMEQDLDDIGEFDMQIPKGYDTGQVRTFVDQAKASIKYFQRRVQERNEHIAKLATAVDRLQVDLHNSKFDAELAAGVNIMPTEESDQLASENTHLKVQVRNLENRIRELEAANSGYEYEPTEEDQERIESLQDQLSIAQREHNMALDENRELRARLVYMEEELDNHQFTVQQDDETPVFHSAEGLDYEESFAEGLIENSALPDLDTTSDNSQDQYQGDGNDTYGEYEAYDTGLPDFDVDDSDEEPEQSGFTDTPYGNSPAFTYVDDEPLDDILPTADDWSDEGDELPDFEPANEQEANIAAALEDDEEDDILDAIMRERQGR